MARRRCKPIALVALMKSTVYLVSRSAATVVIPMCPLVQTAPWLYRQKDTCAPRPESYPLTRTTGNAPLTARPPNHSTVPSSVALSTDRFLGDSSRVTWDGNPVDATTTCSADMDTTLCKVAGTARWESTNYCDAVPTLSSSSSSSRGDGAVSPEALQEAERPPELRDLDSTDCDSDSSADQVPVGNVQGGIGGFDRNHFDITSSWEDGVASSEKGIGGDGGGDGGYVPVAGEDRVRPTDKSARISERTFEHRAADSITSLENTAESVFDSDTQERQTGADVVGVFENPDGVVKASIVDSDNEVVSETEQPSWVGDEAPEGQKRQGGEKHKDGSSVSAEEPMQDGLDDASDIVEGREVVDDRVLGTESIVSTIGLNPADDTTSVRPEPKCPSFGGPLSFAAVDTWGSEDFQSTAKTGPDYETRLAMDQPVKDKIYVEAEPGAVAGVEPAKRSSLVEGAEGGITPSGTTPVPGLDAMILMERAVTVSDELEGLVGGREEGAGPGCEPTVARSNDEQPGTGGERSIAGRDAVAANTKGKGLLGVGRRAVCEIPPLLPMMCETPGPDPQVIPREGMTDVATGTPIHPPGALDPWDAVHMEAERLAASEVRQKAGAPGEQPAETGEEGGTKAPAETLESEKGPVDLSISSDEDVVEKTGFEFLGQELGSTSITSATAIASEPTVDVFPSGVPTGSGDRGPIVKGVGKNIGDGRSDLAQQAGKKPPSIQLNEISEREIKRQSGQRGREKRRQKAGQEDGFFGQWTFSWRSVSLCLVVGVVLTVTYSPGRLPDWVPFLGGDPNEGWASDLDAVIGSVRSRAGSFLETRHFPQGDDDSDLPDLVLDEPEFSGGETNRTGSSGGVNPYRNSSDDAELMWDTRPKPLDRLVFDPVLGVVPWGVLNAWARPQPCSEYSRPREGSWAGDVVPAQAGGGIDNRGPTGGLVECCGPDRETAVGRKRDKRRLPPVRYTPEWYKWREARQGNVVNGEAEGRKAQVVAGQVSAAGRTCGIIGVGDGGRGGERGVCAGKTGKRTGGAATAAAPATHTPRCLTTPSAPAASGLQGPGIETSTSGGGDGEDDVTADNVEIPICTIVDDLPENGTTLEFRPPEHSAPLSSAGPGQTVYRVA